MTLNYTHGKLKTPIPSMTGVVSFFFFFLSFFFNSRCKIPAFANDSFQIRNRAHGDLANMSIPRVSSSTSGFSQCLVYSDVWRAAKEYDHVEPAAGGLAKWRNAWNTTSVENGMKFDSTRETRQCHEWVYDRSEFDSTAITEVCCKSDIYFSGVFNKISCLQIL